MTVKLYHNDMSTCAQKVRLALEEMGIEWESHHLKLRGDEQLRPEYLAINPKGQIPALVDGETIVVESTVINEYLVDSRSVDRLLPDDAVGRARMRWWTRQTDDDVFQSTGIMSQAISFRHQYLATGKQNVDHILASIPDEARREVKRTAFATGMGNPALPMAARRMNKLLGDMESALSDSPWLVGSRLSLADIGMLPFVLRMEHLNMQVMFADRPHLQGWLIRYKELPSYAAAIERWLNPDYLVLTEQTGREAEPDITKMLVAA